MHSFLQTLSSWVWGVPLIVLLVGTGIFLTIRLRWLQVTKLGIALYLGFIKRKEKGAKGDISNFQALMTALAATVGVGNIAGVATAVAIGGPGALFWMWITGLFGMATKYSEAILAVKYRTIDKNGKMCGGPMYYIEKGMGLKWLGVLFAVFTSIATFGIGNMVQANTVADSVNFMWHTSPHVIGIIVAVLTGLVVVGGIKSIAWASSVITPVMILFYMIATTIIILLHIDKVPSVLLLIVKNAFTGTAAIGGFSGASIMMAIRMGTARGIFSNESGLGSAPIVAAAAKTRKPVTQALVSMTQTFIDTIIVCMLTGLVILVTDSWQTGESAAKLTLTAFSRGLPGNLGEYAVTISIVLFAYSTLIGWGYYGEKAMEYLFHEKIIIPYRIVFCVFAYLGCVVKLESVWNFADIMNGLMAIPNLIALVALSGVVVSETKRLRLVRKRRS
jgi:AGCS family alanine or glycine:cation symporter